MKKEKDAILLLLCSNKRRKPTSELRLTYGYVREQKKKWSQRHFIKQIATYLNLDIYLDSMKLYQ